MSGSTDDTRTLGQWLTRLRTRSALASADLAALVGVTKRTLLDWERGRTHPNALRLRRLLAALAAHGAFAPPLASAEAAALWDQAKSEAKQHLGPFDAAWFDQLLAGLPPRVLVTPLADWSEAADVGTLAHRDTELDTLRRLLDDERRRLVGVIGIGGIGKTSLVVAFGQHAATRNPDTDRGFDTVVYGSLRNAPPLNTLIDSLIHTLAPHVAAAPNATLDTTITVLLDLLHARRVLLILDQLETILQPGTTTAQYRAQYADYGRLLYRLGEDSHQSCLIVISREKPAELTELEARGLPAATLTVRGLSEAACQRLLAGRQIRGTNAEWAALAHQFGGNPLALKLVAEPIVDRFGGDIGAFLASNVALLERVRALIEQHVKRLSPLELDLLRWLALAREPIAAADLLAMSMAPVARSYLLEALEGLRRRNLVERAATWPAFFLHPMVMDYVTERLVKQAYAEIVGGELQLLREYALVQTSAPKPVQQSQKRAIIQPLLDALQRADTSSEALVGRLGQLLAAQRALPRAQQGYAEANLLTLLIAADQDPSPRLDDPGPADHHGVPALPRSEPCST
jgi:transcriptional regulator with XRE-family HTH domain